MDLRKLNPLRHLTWHQLDILQIVANSFLVLICFVSAWYARVDPMFCGLCVALLIFSCYLLVRSVYWMHESERELTKMLAAMNKIKVLLQEAQVRREKEGQSNDNSSETQP